MQPCTAAQDGSLAKRLESRRGDVDCYAVGQQRPRSYEYRRTNFPRHLVLRHAGTLVVGYLCAFNLRGTPVRHPRVEGLYSLQLAKQLIDEAVK